MVYKSLKHSCSKYLYLGILVVGIILILRLKFKKCLYEYRHNRVVDMGGYLGWNSRRWCSSSLQHKCFGTVESFKDSLSVKYLLYFGTFYGIVLSKYVQYTSSLVLVCYVLRNQLCLYDCHENLYFVIR